MAAISTNGLLEVIGSWLTPTILFIILNLTILTIFILNSQRQHQTNPVRAPSLFERVTSINLSMYQSEPQQLVRSPSLLERVKSINFRTEPKPEEEPVHVERSNSEKVKKKVVKKKLRKSASEKITVETEETTERLRPATVREKTRAFNNEVDEKADDFINRFRQQLKLQRLDSILRYNRGTQGK